MEGVRRRGRWGGGKEGKGEEGRCKCRGKFFVSTNSLLDCSRSCSSSTHSSSCAHHTHRPCTCVWPRAVVSCTCTALGHCGVTWCGVDVSRAPSSPSCTLMTRGRRVVRGAGIRACNNNAFLHDARVLLKLGSTTRLSHIPLPLHYRCSTNAFIIRQVLGLYSLLLCSTCSRCFSSGWFFLIIKS